MKFVLKDGRSAILMKSTNTRAITPYLGTPLRAPNAPHLGRLALSRLLYNAVVAFENTFIRLLIMCIGIRFNFLVMEVRKQKRLNSPSHYTHIILYQEHSAEDKGLMTSSYFLTKPTVLERD